MHHSPYPVAKQLEHLKKKELKEIYASIAIKTFALSLIGIFIPLFLYAELNYPFTKIISFYLILYLTIIISSPIITKIVSKIGLKHSILISMPITILALISLEFLKSGLLHYSIPSILMALASLLFWIAFHAEFAKYSDKKQRGKQTSIWHSLILTSNILGPITGALIITYFNSTQQQKIIEQASKTETSKQIEISTNSAANKVIKAIRQELSDIDNPPGSETIMEMDVIPFDNQIQHLDNVSQFERGYKAMNEKRYYDAIQLFEKYLKVNEQETANTLIILGNAYFGVEDYDNAIESFEKNLSINPDNAKAYYGWGTSLLRQGETEAAKIKFHKT